MITIRRLKNDSNKSDKELNDSKYYELKYKTEYFVAVFSVIVALAGLLGYNSLQSAKDEIKMDLLQKTKSLDSALVQTDNRIKSKDSILKIVEKKHDLLIKAIPVNERKIDFLNYQITSLEKMINDLNSKNKIRQSFYIVKSLGLKNTDSVTSMKFSYADLTTNIGDKLPKFDKPPFIVPIPEVFANIEIHNVAIDGFTATLGIYVDEVDTFKFSVLIIENK
ncbi:MAG: hypothetical protein A2X13_12280 [Bacteroidetes bacterium GWC2_33_15]|nr:MAG: hypothetical protein A2X13_12280 [Bacteroidetes bacterium GWC2_33_15]